MLKRFCSALAAAVSMFSILPAPRTVWHEENTGLLLPLFPAVGALLGALCYGAARLLAFLQPPLLLQGAVLCLLFPALAGFFHLDGLADVADAIGSRRDKAERVRILKDPHLGAFGAIGLCVYWMLSWAAACGVLERPAHLLVLLFIPVFSRCVCGILILRAPLLSAEGYAALYRRYTRRGAVVWLWALGLACWALCGWLCGAAGALTLGVLLATVLVSAGGACRALGGINGDVSGFALCAGEAAALICLACL